MFAFRLTSSDNMKGMWFPKCAADGSFTPKWRSASFMAGLSRALNAMPAERHPLVTNACAEISVGDRVLPEAPPAAAEYSLEYTTHFCR